ncbi:phytanoyl-CoA dioxygenase family protein [Streptomyces sp. H27-D2]|uniref:phytanoyl-CoA dioxygenase family protein n=1 Tax=Streptomyces sp. H27-D2 TaxID=3046304 RepID=UPI002DB93D6E|nr:phytanoyl-CoA dioxygenase family protein [Streptomyces sp. H27-D2]MEC4016373.1 phytanoyl-CoA dioxygenase family protein [Streptomyces sp. H27-D2]
MPGLTKQQIDDYRRDGFVVIPSVLSVEDVVLIDSSIAELAGAGEEEIAGIFEFEKETIDGERTARRLYNPYEQHENFRKLATDKRITDRVVSLLGPDLALQHSKLNLKPPRVGAPVDWHQDLTYFPHTNDDLVAVLIYLDDATRDNGCIEVLPRLHHRFLDHAMPDGTFAGRIVENLDDERHGAPVAVEGTAGSAILLHPLTPHRSAQNRSPARRRALIYQYRAADAFPIYTGKHLVAMEDCAHHIRGERASVARFGGPCPVIYRPHGSPKSLYQLQESSRKK